MKRLGRASQGGLEYQHMRSEHKYGPIIGLSHDLRDSSRITCTPRALHSWPSQALEDSFGEREKLHRTSIDLRKMPRFGNVN